MVDNLFELKSQNIDFLMALGCEFGLTPPPGPYYYPTMVPFPIISGYILEFYSLPTLESSIGEVALRLPLFFPATIGCFLPVHGAQPINLIMNILIFSRIISW